MCIPLKHGHGTSRRFWLYFTSPKKLCIFHFNIFKHHLVLAQHRWSTTSPTRHHNHTINRKHEWVWPLSGDEVHIVSDGCVVLGPLLGWGVVARALGFRRVCIREAAPTQQQTRDKRSQHRPRSQQGGHLETNRWRNKLQDVPEQKAWYNKWKMKMDLLGWWCCPVCSFSLDPQLYIVLDDYLMRAHSLLTTPLMFPSRFGKGVTTHVPLARTHLDFMALNSSVAHHVDARCFRPYGK